MNEINEQVRKVVDTEICVKEHWAGWDNFCLGPAWTF
jgi:hypothetical protein